MKSRLKKIIVFLVLQFVCIFAFTGCVNSTVIERLKNRYGVDTQLLTDYEIVCDIKGDTFTGRAPHYAVIQLKAEPTEFLQSYADKKENIDGFSKEKNIEIKNLIDADTCMEIPNEYYPNWNDDYIWNCIGDLDKLYTLYFPNEYKLVFFETGH